jgi:hypothetical protein
VRSTIRKLILRSGFYDSEVLICLRFVNMCWIKMAAKLKTYSYSLVQMEFPQQGTRILFNKTKNVHSELSSSVLSFT